MTAIYLKDPLALEKLEAKLADLLAEHSKMAAARRKKSRLPLLNYLCDELEFPDPNGEGTWFYPMTVMRKVRYQRLPVSIRGTRVPSRCEHRVRWVDEWTTDDGDKLTGPVFLRDSRVYERRMPGEEREIEGPVVTAKQLSNSTKLICCVRERIAIVKERRK